MGYQIIKQPDGLLCIWSSYSDQIVASDGTPEEIVEWFADLAAQESRIRTRASIDAVLRGEPRYYQFARTWKEVRKDYYRFRKEHDASLR
jgi:trehalose/maltose hydrolase-like predicted phosphorylase